MIQRVAEWLVAALVRGLYATARKRRVNWQVVEGLAERGTPAIYALWHNNLLFFGRELGGRGLGAMVSRSKDGEGIARILAGWGFQVVRGSSSNGGKAAFREYLRLLKSGAGVAITPDGPRGPRYVLQEGVAALARLSGAPIVPVHYAAPRCWQAGSWDRMKLPKPFSRVVVMAGTPLYLSREETPGDRERVEGALRRLSAVAEAFAQTGLLRQEPLLAQALEDRISSRVS
ncbi:MAG: lysophospholipid acyltransferase family protein [Deltaproteobacteria bacterium]|nr:lysophospholipid acyltransferase family protein [Deltaproteobacteria bacterium]